MLVTAETLLSFLQMGTLAASCWDKHRLKIHFRIGTKITERFITKLGTPKHPTNFDGHTGLIALQISKSETEAEDKKSEDRKGEGKAPGQELQVSAGGSRTTIIIVPVLANKGILQ
jgi:hypothetical protein